MESKNEDSGQRTFLTIWIGQLVSVLGTSLTAFALSIWVFQTTGSVTQFGFVIIAVALPGLLVAPVAGVIVDRLDRRWVMLASDAGAALTTLAIAGLYMSGSLEVWHVAAAMAVNSLLAAFQEPAYAASITLLVDKRNYTRANGMVQTGQGLAAVFAPMIAGFLLPVIDVGGIILVDVLTFVAAVLTLAIVRIPRPTGASEKAAAKSNFREEASLGWRFIRSRRGLLGLLLFFTVTNLFTAATNVLMAPMVLSFATVTTTGIIASVFGIGMLAGSILITAWGGPERRVFGVAVFGLVNGLALAVVGLRPDVFVIGTGIFLLAFTRPAIDACSQSIWQSKTPADIQGRVFSLRRMIAQAATPVGFILAGPLADGIFEPLMASGGDLAGTLGPYIGTGAGRGMALMTVVMGLLSMLAAVVVILHPRVRLLEAELPDQLAQTAS